MNRREFVKCTSYAAVGSTLPTLSSCSFGSSRGFYLEDAIQFSPKGLLKDIGFYLAGKSLDYLDTQCESCGKLYRLFNLAMLAIDAAAMVYCPECSLAKRIVVVGSRYLTSKLVEYSVDKAMAIPQGNGHFVHFVGSSDGMGVSRSSVCYRINGREPFGQFNRRIEAVPSIINYFTHVKGASYLTNVYHVWRRNGVVTDKIRLNIESSSYRTWSNKENLGVGLWTVTAENSSGHILDSQMFHIGSDVGYLRT